MFVQVELKSQPGALQMTGELEGERELTSRRDACTDATTSEQNPVSLRVPRHPTKQIMELEPSSLLSFEYPLYSFGSMCSRMNEIICAPKIATQGASAGALLII